MSPDAGQLTYRVAVQSPTKTRDATGQPIPAWATDATVWGDYRPTGGAEVEGPGGQVRAVVSGVVWVRHRAGLTAEKRLVVNGYGTTDLTLHVVAVGRPDPVTGLVPLYVREPDTLREAT